jgi:hypothetical protein
VSVHSCSFLFITGHFLCHKSVTRLLKPCVFDPFMNRTRPRAVLGLRCGTDLRGSGVRRRSCRTEERIVILHHRRQPVRVRARYREPGVEIVLDRSLQRCRRAVSAGQRPILVSALPSSSRRNTNQFNYFRRASQAGCTTVVFHFRKVEITTNRWSKSFE